MMTSLAGHGRYRTDGLRPLWTHCGHLIRCHNPPMEQLGLIGIAAAGLWLIFVGLVMARFPGRALRMLSLAASTRTINNLEQGLRFVAGVCLLLRSPAAKLPQTFEIGGWFIILSSLALLVVPLRWHSAYAMWWAERITPRVVRSLAPLSAMAGIGLIYAAV